MFRLDGNTHNLSKCFSGPVHHKYKLLLDKAERDGYIETQDYDYGTTMLEPGEVSITLLKDKLLSDKEIHMIKKVVQGWKSATAQELSDYTHRLPACTFT